MNFFEKIKNRNRQDINTIETVPLETNRIREVDLTGSNDSMLSMVISEEVRDPIIDWSEAADNKQLLTELPFDNMQISFQRNKKETRSKYSI